MREYQERDPRRDYEKQTFKALQEAAAEGRADGLLLLDGHPELPSARVDFHAQTALHRPRGTIVRVRAPAAGARRDVASATTGQRLRLHFAAEAADLRSSRCSFEAGSDVIGERRPSCHVLAVGDVPRARARRRRAYLLRAGELTSGPPLRSTAPTRAPLRRNDPSILTAHEPATSFSALRCITRRGNRPFDGPPA